LDAALFGWVEYSAQNLACITMKVEPICYLQAFLVDYLDHASNALGTELWGGNCSERAISEEEWTIVGS
jgi:hypothetical protein